MLAAKKIIAGLVTVLYFFPCVAQQKTTSVLTNSLLQRYVNRFNATDTQDVQNYVPDIKAYDWLTANVPLFECPDSTIEKIYYYRWWTFRKHLKQTDDGFIFTEFITPVKHAGKYNSVSSALGHHIYEGRWLRDTQYIQQYIRFWLQKDKTFKASRLYSFSGWTEDAVFQLYKVQYDKPFIRSLFNDMDTDYHRWEKDRQLPSGLFWQYDVKDAMEESISGGRKVKNRRPSINSYMYGNAVAMTHMAGILQRKDMMQQYQAKATQLRALIKDSLWDDTAYFFKTRLENGLLSDAREAIGFIPWYFNLPADEKKYGRVWNQLTDTIGFWAPWGLTTAERRHPAFRTHGSGHSCEWDGAIWPFATTQTLKGFSNLLNNYHAYPKQLSAATFLDALHTYAWAHQKNGQPYVGEYQDEKTGYWLKGDNERSSFYNHSGFCDLVINDLVGLKPREDNRIEVSSLVPAAKWDWFCLDKVLYHGRLLTILWDKNGTRYHKGKGLRVYADGKEILYSPKLQAVSVAL
jgi:hypothetical protein